MGYSIQMLLIEQIKALRLTPGSEVVVRMQHTYSNLFPLGVRHLLAEFSVTNRSNIMALDKDAKKLLRSMVKNNNLVPNAQLLSKPGSFPTEKHYQVVGCYKPELADVQHNRDLDAQRKYQHNLKKLAA